MLMSISPLGEQARGNRWAVTVAWLTLGGILGGAAVGIALGLPGSVLTGALSDRWRLGALATAGLAAAAWDLSGRRFPGRRQVNEDWLTSLRSWVYGIGFGVQLGAPPATVLNTALVPLFMLAAVLSASPTHGALIGAVFGAVRGVSVTVNRRVRSAGDLAALHRRIDVLSNQAKRTGAAFSAALGGVAVVSLVA